MSELREKMTLHWEGIIKDLEEQYIQNPNDLTPLTKKIFALTLLERFDEALTLADEIIKKEKTAYNLVCKAEVYLKMEDKQKALEICNKALGLEPNNEFALKLRKEITKPELNILLIVVIIILITMSLTFIL